MSQEVDKQVEEKAEVQEPVEQKEVNVEALMERLEKVEQTNQRLLNESKTYKEKYQGLRSEVETKEKQKLEESENWKELLEMEKNKKFELEQSYKDLRKKTLREKINFEVARHAKDAHDAGDVISAIFNDAKDLVHIDEENLSVSGIKEAVEFVKQRKPYYFDSKKSVGMPSSRPVGEDGRVSFENLSKEEQDKLFVDALSKL